MDARVLLATGHEILMDGLAALLREEQGIRSVTPARSGAEALEILEQAPLDVLVVALDLPDIAAGIDLIERVQRERRPVRCIAMVGRRRHPDLDRIMRAGAAGIVSTHSSARVLADAVRSVHVGRGYVATDVTNALVSRARPPGPAPGTETVSLTVREGQVLRLIAEDRSSREIASELGISPRTVETHRGHLMKKLKLHNAAALVRYAVREGLVAA